MGDFHSHKQRIRNSRGVSYTPVLYFMQSRLSHLGISFSVMSAVTDGGNERFSTQSLVSVSVPTRRPFNVLIQSHSDTAG